MTFNDEMFFFSIFVEFKWIILGPSVSSMIEFYTPLFLFFSILFIW